MHIPDALRIRVVSDDERSAFNALAPHPLQSWEWGIFRHRLGVDVVRLGGYTADGKLAETAQIMLHSLPFSSRPIGYFPKGRIPSESMFRAIRLSPPTSRCIFVKLEPLAVDCSEERQKLSRHFPFSGQLLVSSSHPLFPCHTFLLDFSPSEDSLFSSFHSKTRYNIRVAKKHGVEIVKDHSPEAFQSYLTLLSETTKRQSFYAHDRRYHEIMWESLSPSGIAHLFSARYRHQGTLHTLASWVVFLFNGTLYYPYGASSRNFRYTMASNLLMWEVIRWGKAQGARRFDMWGALGSDASIRDPWFGFHSFKQGYGGALVSYIGSYDFVFSPVFYRLYSAAYSLRSRILSIQKTLSRR